MCAKTLMTLAVSISMTIAVLASAADGSKQAVLADRHEVREDHAEGASRKAIAHEAKDLREDPLDRRENRRELRKEPRRAN
jgi:hypothetical protein